MNKKMMLLFSHKLSDEQIEDAKKSYNIENFIYLPKELQDLWSNIPPDIDTLERLLYPIKVFLKEQAKKDDLVLIQGDFGASFLMVKFSKTLELLPVYATTKRLAKEYIENGKNVKETIFKHRRFREYGK